MLHRAALALAISGSVLGCAATHDERADPSTPAAMVGLPGPAVAAPLATSATSAPSPVPLDPMAPPLDVKRTRVIADPPAPEPAHHGRRIDLDVKGADIHDVLRLLADAGRVSIVVGDDVQGSVTVRMRQVPWDRALDVILRAKGFFAERDGDVILVTGKPR